MESLLGIRDELAAAKILAAALYMACDARSMLGEQRAALCEASNTVCQRLEVIIVALGQPCARRVYLHVVGRATGPYRRRATRG